MMIEQKTITIDEIETSILTKLYELDEKRAKYNAAYAEYSQYETDMRQMNRPELIECCKEKSIQYARRNRTLLEQELLQIKSAACRLRERINEIEALSKQIYALESRLNHMINHE